MPPAFDAKTSVKEIDKDDEPFNNQNYYNHNCARVPSAFDSKPAAKVNKNQPFHKQKINNPQY